MSVTTAVRLWCVVFVFFDRTNHNKTYKQKTCDGFRQLSVLGCALKEKKKKFVLRRVRARPSIALAVGRSVLTARRIRVFNFLSSRRVTVFCLHLHPGAYIYIYTYSFCCCSSADTFFSLSLCYCFFQCFPRQFR